MGDLGGHSTRAGSGTAAARVTELQPEPSSIASRQGNRIPAAVPHGSARPDGGGSGTLSASSTSTAASPAAPTPGHQQPRMAAGAAAAATTPPTRLAAGATAVTARLTHAAAAGMFSTLTSATHMLQVASHIHVYIYMWRGCQERMLCLMGRRGEGERRVFWLRLL
jgi:hypothetical protein